MIPSLNLHHIAHLEEKEEGREENLISDIVIDGLYHFTLHLCVCTVGNVGILLEGNKLLLAVCVGFVSLWKAIKCYWFSRPVLDAVNCRFVVVTRSTNCSSHIDTIIYIVLVHKTKESVWITPSPAPSIKTDWVIKTVAAAVVYLILTESLCQSQMLMGKVIFQYVLKVLFKRRFFPDRLKRNTSSPTNIYDP